MRDFSNVNLTAFSKALSGFAIQYRVWLNVGAAFGVLTGVLAFIILLSQLAAKSDQPQERRKVLTELVVVGVCTALLGSITIIMNMFYAIMLLG